MDFHRCVWELNNTVWPWLEQAFSRSVHASLDYLNSPIIFPKCISVTLSTFLTCTVSTKHLPVWKHFQLQATAYPVAVPVRRFQTKPGSLQLSVHNVHDIDVLLNDWVPDILAKVNLKLGRPS